MPELPEVQALADFLDARARGRRIERVQMLSFTALKSLAPPPSALAGRVVAHCTRRGKFLLVLTVPANAPDEPSGGRSEQGAARGAGSVADGGPAVDQLWLAVHFALAGWLRWYEPGLGDQLADPRGHGPGARGATADERPAELRAVPRRVPAPGVPGRGPGTGITGRLLRPGGPVAMRVELEGGAGFNLTEAGTRKRLAIHVVRAPEDVPAIARLGIDPLDPAFDADALGRLLAGRTGQLKHLLADQALIAGVGNAYSDEALHAARLSPFRPAGNLAPGEVAGLHAALLGVLREALARNEGVPPAALKDGKRAAMRVHGRTGLACPVCGDTIREVAFAERSLQYCPTCQTGGRPLADRRMSRLLR